MDDFGEELARAGYVVAINRYRLSRDINSPEKFYDALFKATSDQKAAIRFLLKDAAGPNRFRIDADNIFIGGHSAGSITRCTVYLDARNKLPDAAVASLQKNGGLDGNSGNETIKFKLRGVINLSGAVFDIDMLDAGEPPCSHIHGDKDDVVPLGSNAAGLHGSATLHARPVEGPQSQLEVIAGGDHIDPPTPSAAPSASR